jgi:hypothetical protein
MQEQPARADADVRYGKRSYAHGEDGVSCSEAAEIIEEREITWRD